MSKELNTNIAYEGNVKVSLKTGNKTIEISNHNKGLPSLFKLISKAIAGFDVSFDKPSYVDLRYSDEQDTETFVSCLSSKQSVTQLNYEIISGSWVTRAVSTIPYSSLSVHPINVLEANEFRLYLMSRDGDLAYITVSNEDIEKILPGTQAVVEWVLKVSNSN